MEEIINTVVWIASYPKSGNTWIHSVIKQAGKNYGYTSTDIDVYNLIRSNNKPSPCPFINEQENCSVLKTHSLFKGKSNTHQELGLIANGFVHVIRNPLDVLLSYINFSRIQYKTKIIQNDTHYANRLFVELLGFDAPISYEKWIDTTIDDISTWNLDHALSYFSKNNGKIPGVFPMSGTYFENNIGWLKQGEIHNTVLIRYEDCLKGNDAFYGLTKIFSFNKTDIDNALSVIEDRKKDNDTSDSKIFYNKMTSNYYKEYFSRNSIDDFIFNNEENLKTIGYEDL